MIERRKTEKKIITLRMLEENKSFSSSIQNNVPGVDYNLRMQSQNSACLPLIIVSIITITFMLFNIF